MNPHATAAWPRTAISCGLALLAAGILRLPDPFLATVTAFVLAGLPRAEGDSPARHALSAMGGWGAGLAVLAAFPQQPWLAIPIFCGVVAWGASRIVAKGAIGSASVFAVGAVAVFSVGTPIVATGTVTRAAAHLLSIGTAVAAAGFARLCFPPAQATSHTGFPSNFPSGFAALFLVYSIGILLIPTSVVPMAVAAGFSLVSLASSPVPLYHQRIGGALVGSTISVVFLTLLSGSGNNLAVFLFGITCLLALLSQLAAAYPGRGAFWNQAGATLAVAATVFPAPPDTLYAPTLRAASVLAGVCLACTGAAMFTPRSSSAPFWRGAQPAFRDTGMRRMPPRG